MKKKIKSMFGTNLALKIGAIFLAFLLWLVISNIQDSIRTKNIKIDITYMNQELLESEGITVVSKPQSITIPVQVRRSKYDQITAANFSATADLTVRNGDDLSRQQVMFQVELKESDDPLIEGWDYPKDGRWITVSMDELQTKQMKVELKKTGELSDTYKLNGSGLVVEPDIVSVTGPKNEFSNLTAIKAEVDLSQLTPENNQLEAAVGFYDANDSIIEPENLKLSHSSVKISAGVLRVKEVTLNFEGTTGTPAAGYGFSEMSSDTNSIVLEGLKASLADVTNITIPKEALDITGASSTIVRRIDITPYLPAETMLSSDNSIIEVTLYIEALKEKSYSVLNQNIQLNGKQQGYYYSLKGGSTSIILKGFQEDLNSLKESQITASVDVTGLGAGTYELPVAVVVKQGFTVTDQPVITVQIAQSPITPPSLESFSSSAMESTVSSAIRQPDLSETEASEQTVTTEKATEVNASASADSRETETAATESEPLNTDSTETESVAAEESASSAESSGSAALQ